MSKSPITKTEFARNDKLFRKACELAKTEPTPRQASKFRGGKGRAYMYVTEARAALSQEA